MSSQSRLILSLCLAVSASACKQEPTPDEVVKRFHQLWYGSPNTWNKNTWMGIPTYQNPMDIWNMQEIIFDTKPDLFVECGSAYGGSAIIWATVLSQVNPEGRVVSIDITDQMNNARALPIAKERIDFLVGSSTAPEIFAQVAEKAKGKKVMVLLDSDHRKPHVLEELKLYAPLIPVGGYLVVQDTNVNGNPVEPEFGPGPREAVDEFMKGNTSFVVDKSRERLLFTFAPGGHLKRVK